MTRRGVLSPFPSIQCFRIFLGLVAGFGLLAGLTLPLFADHEEFRERLDRRLRRLGRGGQPGFAAMVIQDGQIVFAEGYGLGDLKRQTPIDSKSVFRLASVSKQFTAMAVMMLCERGKLGFSDPVTKHIEDSVFEGITVEHLLHHTSGLADYMELTEKAWDKSRIADNDDILTLYRKLRPDPLFEPGAGWMYSNTGYALLASLVEIAAGEPFEHFVKREIFEKLGMKSSWVFRGSSSTKIPNRVLGYRGAGRQAVEMDFHYLNGVVGDGAVYTSLEDYFLWDQALFSERLVSSETLERAFTPGRLSNGELASRGASAGQGYGYGWQVRVEDGKKVVSHGGSWVGFRTFVERHLSERRTLVVFANSPAVDLQGVLGLIRGHCEKEFGDRG